MPANDGLCVAKNTFIEISDEQDDAAQYRQANRRAYRTMPDACVTRLADEADGDEDVDCSAVGEDAGANSPELSPILLGSERRVGVKNTFIDLSADDKTPAARQHKTCALDGIHGEHNLESVNDQEEEPADAAAARPRVAFNLAEDVGCSTEDLKANYNTGATPKSDGCSTEDLQANFVRGQDSPTDSEPADETIPSLSRAGRRKYMQTEDLREEFMNQAADAGGLPSPQCSMQSPGRMTFNLQEALDGDGQAGHHPQLPIPSRGCDSGCQTEVASPQMHPAQAAPLLSPMAAAGYAWQAANLQAQGMAQAMHMSLMMGMNPPSTSPMHAPSGAPPPPWLLPPQPASSYALPTPCGAPPMWPYHPGLTHPGFSAPWPVPPLPTAAPGYWPGPPPPAMSAAAMAAAAGMGQWPPPPAMAWQLPPTAAPAGFPAKNGGTEPPPTAQPATETARLGAGAVRGPRMRARLWTHIYLHMQAPEFDLVPMLIGRGGCNMKKIATKTNAKIRIRGRGSGHLEVDNKQEAPTPLMVAVTTDHADQGSFKEAVRMTLEILEATSERYQQHCEKKQLPCTAPFYSIGLVADGGQEMLGDILEGVPVAPPPAGRESS